MSQAGLMPCRDLSSQRGGAPGVLDWLWLAAAVFAVPHLFWIILKMNLLGAGQNRALGLLLMMLGASIIFLSWPRLQALRLPTLPLLVGGGCSLLICAILWNKLFLANFTITGFDQDIFRAAHYNGHAPLYGKLVKEFPTWGALPIAIAALFVCDLARRPLAQLDARGTLVRLALFQIALTLAFAVSDYYSRPRSFLRFGYGTLRFRNFFIGASEMLRTYVEKMHLLPGKGRHYPPGFPLLHILEAKFHCQQVMEVLGVLLPALCIIPVYALARELGSCRRAAAMAATLYCTAANVLIFPSVEPSTILVIFPVTSLWLLAYGLNRGALWTGPLIGLCFALYVLMTFAAYMTAILMGLFVIFAVLSRAARPGRVVTIIVLSLTAFAAFFAIFYLATRFNIVACFREGSRLHLTQSGSGFDHPVRYLFRSTGGIIAFLIAVGFPISVLACAALRGRARAAEPRALLRPFFRAAALAVVLAGFSGMSFLETERIWLFFVPPLAVLAGWELCRRSEIEGRWVFAGTILIALVFSCTYKLYFEHSMRFQRLTRPAHMQQPYLPWATD